MAFCYLPRWLLCVLIYLFLIPELGFSAVFGASIVGYSVIYFLYALYVQKRVSRTPGAYTKFWTAVFIINAYSIGIYLCIGEFFINNFRAWRKGIYSATSIPYFFIDAGIFTSATSLIIPLFFRLVNHMFQGTDSRI